MCELVEVFSVTYIGGDGGAPGGTISVHDGKRGQFIYRGDENQTACHEQRHPISGGNQKGDNDVKLQLTGPYRAISADGCVAIELDLHHGCHASSFMRKIHIDIYDDSLKYDVAIPKEVKTCNCHESRSAVVIYAVLSDAVEASVEVVSDLTVGFSVHKIIALVSDVGTLVLFESNDKENSCPKSLEGKMMIPLARSVLAVPLYSSLKIKVQLRASSFTEITEDSVQCDPDNLDREHDFCHAGMYGYLHLKIIFSD